VRSLPQLPYEGRLYSSHQPVTSSQKNHRPSHPSHKPNLQFAKRKSRSESDVP
jgi:hypothetical protein